MTFEEAKRQCDPFDNCWIWTDVSRLARDGYQYVLIVRTCDWRSTLFSCSRKTYADQIRRVPDPTDLLWENYLTERDGDDWQAGAVTDMMQWARRLFNDV